MSEFRELIEKQMTALSAHLETLDKNSMEYKKGIENFNALRESMMKEDQLEAEIKLKERQAANDELYHEERRLDDLKKAKRETIFEIIRTSLTAFGIAAPLAVQAILVKKSWLVEIAGHTFTSRAAQFVKGLSFKK